MTKIRHEGRTFLVNPTNGAVLGRPHTRDGRAYGKWGLAYVTADQAAAVLAQVTR